ncbi:MAG: hypothetical protein ACTSYH_03455 [Candidatus Heimdallarchaeaceae archaeon]
MAVCEEHGVLLGKLESIDGRLNRIDESADKQWDAIEGIREDLADIKSSLAVLKVTTKLFTNDKNQCLDNTNQGKSKFVPSFGFGLGISIPASIAYILKIVYN